MVPDWIAYAAMAVMLIGTLASLAGLALLLVALYRALERMLAAMARARRTARHVEELVQLLADPDQRLMPCHNIRCGAHMHTPHHPDAAGVLRCEACGTPATA